MSGTERYIQQLAVFDLLREDVIRDVIRSLQLPPGSHGLDAGCGIGLQTLPLADAVGPAGHVTGLDLRPEFLTYAERVADRAGLSERVSFEQGDVRDLPFEDDTFDWAWSADCVGYAPLEPLPLLRELTRVVRPGGIVAIAAYSSETLLPGYPLLEANLRATSAAIAPFVVGRSPQLRFLRALGWFREIGLVGTTARTFAGTGHAPLTDALRAALVALFEMRWPGVESELNREDWVEFQRLCLSDSPDFIVDQPDYTAFFTYTVFSGHVP